MLAELCAGLQGLLQIDHIYQLSAVLDDGVVVMIGIPTLNIGPGDPRLAHQADEFIEIEELLTCTKMIASIVMDWCGAEENS